MRLEKIIKSKSVLCNVEARSKKHCLEILSKLMVQIYPEFTCDQIFEYLNKRERLGCTGLDSGVAFPHCRIGNIGSSCAALIKLSKPVDFDAADGELVDLIFGMLVPEDLNETDYADIKVITKLLGNEKLLSKLRSANSNIKLYNTLINGSGLDIQD